MKRILVTGATGYIGRHVLSPLARYGYEIHATSTRAGPGLPPEVIVHRVDLFDAAGVDGLLAAVRPSRLLHLAWNVTPPDYWSSAENLSWVQSSLGLALAFQRAGGERIVVAGSCAEYDWTRGVCKENQTECAPVSLYGTCKDALRRMLLGFAARTGLSAAWGRVFHSFGPGEHRSRLVPSLASALLAGRPAVCRNGEQIRDFLDVRDVGGAFAALVAGEVTGAINLASGEGVPLGRVARLLGELAGRHDLVEVCDAADAAAGPPVLIADTGRLAREVGWKPAHTLEAGLADALEYWRR